jgi:DNA-binding GntR family transcriptional regulator
VRVPIDRADPTAITVQIAEDLRRRIAEGEFDEDHRMPSLRALAAEYEVAELTAHAAVKQLQSEGLIVSAPGRGTYVRASGEPTPDVADLAGQVAALQLDMAEIRRRLERLEQRAGESS